MRSWEVVEGLRYRGKNGKIGPAKEKQTQEIQSTGSQIFSSKGRKGLYLERALLVKRTSNDLSIKLSRNNLSPNMHCTKLEEKKN